MTEQEIVDTLNEVNNHRRGMYCLLKRAGDDAENIREFDQFISRVRILVASGFVKTSPDQIIRDDTPPFSYEEIICQITDSGMRILGLKAD